MPSFPDTYPDTVTTTHQVENQPPPFEGHNAWEIDPAFQEAVLREGNLAPSSDGIQHLQCYGGIVGSAKMVALAEDSNNHTPVLHSHDRYGHRIDEVEFHPSWHELLTITKSNGLHSLPWVAEGEAAKGAHVVRAGLQYLQAQGENGVQCPIAMTFAAAPTLRHQPDLAAVWLPKITASSYDSRFIPAAEKDDALIGMAMTEKQGGSDVRANSTRAEPTGAEPTGADGAWLLTGHKWFCSAPMCDAFLTLAYTEKGLSCFLVPRWLPDGTRNRFFIQRLKNKLGNRSNASSEIEYDRTWAQMVGEEGRGVPTIIEMVHHTRLECTIGASGIMRHAVALALHHARHRSAFQKRLIDQPLMQSLLADIALESEAAMACTIRLARAFDEAQQGGEAEQALSRILTPILKYWTTKRVTGVVYEAMEVHGGNGYVEDGPLARLYREAPLNGIWEGSGNVMCLDVLRAMSKDPDAVGLLLTELAQARGGHVDFDQHLTKLEQDLAKGFPDEAGARRLVERLAQTVQAALLIRFAPAPVSDAFCRARLAFDTGHAYGTLPNGPHIQAILGRALVA